jgi:hypothetical protein
VHGLLLILLLAGMFLVNGALHVMAGGGHDLQRDKDSLGQTVGIALALSLFYSVAVPWVRRRLDAASLTGSFVTTTCLVLVGLLLWRDARVPPAESAGLVVTYLLFGLAPGLIGWRASEPAWMRRFPPTKRP